MGGSVCTGELYILSVLYKAALNLPSYSIKDIGLWRLKIEKKKFSFNRRGGHQRQIGREGGPGGEE